MSITNIALSGSETANLLSLQNIGTEQAQTEYDLSTGNKVNDALDNATAYFTSQGFLDRANDLSNVSDDLSTSLSAIQSTSNSIDALTSIVEEMQGLTTSAQATSDTTSRASYATQYNSLLIQLDGIINDADFNGVNLLKSGNSLTINFDEYNTTGLTISGIDLSAAGLSLSSVTDAWVTTADITTTADALNSALDTLRSSATEFGDNANIVETRQTFTSSLITLLQSASDNLVVADDNTEAAYEQALQTRQQLAVDSLSLSNQDQQAVLKLFQ